MKMTGEEMTGGGKSGTWYAKAEGDGGPIDSWCATVSMAIVRTTDQVRIATATDPWHWPLTT